ncbi:MAG: hypothetical protein AAB441_04225 [Patescibacteria group bacterium]
MTERKIITRFNSQAHNLRFLIRARSNSPLPQSAFIEYKRPKKDEYGREVSVKAEEVKRARSETFWDIKNESLGIKDSNDYQVIVMESPHRFNKEKKIENTDVTSDMLEALKKNQMGRYPVRIFEKSHFANDVEARKIIGNERVVPEVVYIVASPLDEKELMNVQVIASHCKKIGVKKVVWIAPFIPFGREDKDGIIVNGQVQYTGQMLTLRAFLHGLRGIVDFIYSEEPHSSAEQAWAAQGGIPYAPISLWKFSIDQIKEEENFDRENLVVMGPDIGRNKAAMRISEDTDSPVIQLNKHRDPETRSIWFDPLSKEQLDIIMGSDRKGGKDLLMYDDEGASLDTAADLLVEAMDKYNPKSVRLILSHSRFTDGFIEKNSKHHYHKGWLENISRIIEIANAKGIKLKIYLTDSRESVGDIEIFEKQPSNLINLQKLSLFLFNQIQEDVDNINPWREHPEVILQN